MRKISEKHPKPKISKKIIKNLAEFGFLKLQIKKMIFLTFFVIIFYNFFDSFHE